MTTLNRSWSVGRVSRVASLVSISFSYFFGELKKWIAARCNWKSTISTLRLPFDRPRELLSLLDGILSSFDPDVIQTHFGDGWLFPKLLELSKKTGIPFNPNRDLSLPVLRRKEVDFFNYGRRIIALLKFICAVVGMWMLKTA
jgi:DNA polymerase elongation subunit (family B)